MITKKKLLALIATGAAIGISTPAMAWYVYSWDGRYSKECHFWENPLNGTHIVCGKWSPAVTKSRNLKPSRVPAEFPENTRVEDVPKEYVSQVEKQLQAHRLQWPRSKQ
jgi:hypothetical protein